jgi:hypothetical protein
MQAIKKYWFDYDSISWSFPRKHMHAQTHFSKWTIVQMHDISYTNISPVCSYEHQIIYTL